MLPQTDCAQTLGVPWHDQPGSVRHVLEQPSALMLLPSSQFSPPIS
jgi:hypothetical protein